MTDTAMQVAAILVAAGRGTRAGAGPAKQYRLVDGEPVLAKALAPFLAEPAVDLIQVVIGAEDEVSYTRAIGDQGFGKLASPVTGGATRQDSVLNGLRALRARGFDGIVLVHDAARAFVSRGLIGTAIEAVREQVAAIPALAVTDTIKRVDSDGRVVETPPRSALVSVQTPQAFHFQPLLAAHEAAAADGVAGLTDDAGLMEWAGHPVATFPGEIGNIKLTHPQDFEREQQAQLPLVVRVGSGYDVHAFTEGDHVWLGGVRIPHDRGVLAHSDGDVALHALTDALLGALADGDIGTHFPPSDPQWKDAASVHFLSFAAERVRQRGGRIDFVDLTIISEAPKVGPYREAIRAVVGRATAISPDQVAIKATTSERLGFVGRREGLEAFATVTIRLPTQE